MKRAVIFSVLCAAINLMSCYNGLNETYNEPWLSSDHFHTFATADTPGDRVKVTAGSATFNMNYVNNSISIVFPTGASDTGTATISRNIFIGQTVVTNALFAEVLQWAKDNNRIVENNGSHNEIDTTPATPTVKYGNQELIDLSGSSVKISYSSGTFSVASGYENYPVVFVNWYGAIMFCNWLTEMMDGDTTNVVYSGIDTTWDHTETVEDASKNGYRLPSNNEWEYAARYIGTNVPTNGNLATEYIAQSVNGGNASLTAGYYWTPGDYASGAIKDYNNYAECDAVAWFGNSLAIGTGNATSLQPVARKKANALGLYDMSGNVNQWCFNVNGTTGRAYRGGSWMANATYLQIYFANTYSTPSWFENRTGFRIVKTK